MIKLKKLLNYKIILIIISAIFLSAQASYGVDLPSKSYLRVPLMGNNEELGKRLKGGVETELSARRPAIGIKNVENYKIKNVVYSINWRSVNGNVFKGDRKSILESLQLFLNDPEKIEFAIKEMGGDSISFDDISKIDVRFMRASERTVFKIDIVLNERYKNQEFNIVAKKVASQGKLDVRQQEAFEKLKHTGLVPEFTLYINDIYFEQWVSGPTVHKVGRKRGLTNKEIRKIASTWVKVGTHLSKPGDYGRFPSDIHAGNIMFRESEDIPEFVVVDIYKRKESQTKPMIFIRNLIRFYVRGKGYFAVKSAIDNDTMPIFLGIYEGFGNDKEKTRKFLKEAIKFGVKDEQNKLIQKEIEEFLEQGFMAMDDQGSNLEGVDENKNTRVCM